jgi:hypothetical protein
MTTCISLRQAPNISYVAPQPSSRLTALLVCMRVLILPVFLAELPLLATAGQLQLALHDTDLDTKAVVVVDGAELGGTVMFEAEADDFDMPAPRSTGSLEDTWRIEPDQLMCRKKPDGALWMLGKGETLRVG